VQPARRGGRRRIGGGAGRAWGLWEWLGYNSQRVDKEWGYMKNLLNTLLGIFLTPLLATAANSSQLSQCYRMTNTQPYTSGLGGGISWKPVGKCIVNLDPDGYPNSIKVLSTGKTVSATFNSPSQGLKPYQNPTGKWVQGIWESDTKRSAIFAIVTW